MRVYEQTIEKFKAKNARVAVIGLGYAGLPLACTFAETGFATVGLDIDNAKIQALRSGNSYIGHISEERISRLVRSRAILPSSEFDLLKECDAAIICVPTPLGEGRVPDLTYVIETAKSVARYLHAGQLVVLESTTYPGTTEEVVLPILADSGLNVGEHFFLAFSPEREDPANPSYSTRTLPKVVGGVTEKCLAVAMTAYSQIVDRAVPASCARAAESAKLLENIYRCVNVALVNELKLLLERMDIDIWEVIQLAATKPFGFTPFYPGPGLGGHCIPVDPFYLTWKARQYDFPTRFIELAGEVNSQMPVHVVERLVEALNERSKPLRGAKVLLIGVAYKRDVDDIRESPALAIIKLLENKFANVIYHDPHVPVLQSRHLMHRLESVELTLETLKSVDAVIIVTDHSTIDYNLIVENAKLIVDTRGATRHLPVKYDKVVAA